MTVRYYIISILITVLSGTTGCSMPGRQKQVQHRDPALPMTLNREELVSYLNNQNQGLDGWQSTSTRLAVRLPNGMYQRLKGAIACQSPQYFRLTASNVIARTDLGSNASRCWVYVKPGESALMTWKHQDTSLLQQIPTGIPYIDPNWLMLVLGIKPLDVNDYELSRGPAGTRELWLTAIEQSATGRPLRRVIKVDTMHGVVREHSVYDSEAHPLVRAVLSGHKPHGGNLIPSCVKLQFPQMDSELALTFGNIEVNPNLPDALWRLPDHGVKVVDLGKIIRNKMLAEGIPFDSQEESPWTEKTVEKSNPFADDDNAFNSPKASLQSPVFDSDDQSKRVKTAALFQPSNDEAPNWDEHASSPAFDEEEPDFDDGPVFHESAFTQEADNSTFVGQPAKTLTKTPPPPPKKKRGFFGLFGG